MDQLFHQLLSIRVIRTTYKILGLMISMLLRSAPSSHAQRMVGATILLVSIGYNKFLIVRQKRKSPYEIDACLLSMVIIVTLIYRSLSTQTRIVFFSQSFRHIQHIDYSHLMLDSFRHSQRITHKELTDFFQRVKASYDSRRETSGLYSMRLGRRLFMRRTYEAHRKRLVYTR